MNLFHTTKTFRFFTSAWLIYQKQSEHKPPEKSRALILKVTSLRSASAFSRIAGFGATSRHGRHVTSDRGRVKGCASRGEKNIEHRIQPRLVAP
jgi:hypothetical protein